jgi:hypothetical protein
MKLTAALAPALLLLAISAPASAHTGATLDMHGCHPDRVRGEYHCHTGPLAGHSFRSQGEMLRVLDSGEIPEKEDKEPSWFQRMWPGSKKKSEEAAAGAAETSTDAQAGAAVAGTTGAPPAPAAPTPPPSDVEERLRILKGLYNMELITEEEYATRRREILEDL